MPKRPLWRRIVRVVAWVLGVLVLLVVLAIAFLHTRWGKAFVRGRIQARLAQTFTGGATLGSLDYGFLFSSVELGDLVINDPAGHPAITIHALHADLDRSSLIAGAPVIDSLAIEGLDVKVTEDAAGRPNLAGLAAPSDRKPLASIAIRAFSIAGAATVTKADGTVLTFTELAVTGSVTARPAAKEVDLALGPLAAKVSVARPGSPRRDLELAIASTKLARRGTATDVAVTQVAAGAVSIEELHGHVQLEDALFVGDQTVSFSKLHLDRNKLRTMLGRSVLVDDVFADLTLTGPIGALVAHGAVTTRSTTLGLDGTIDLSNRVHPRFAITLAGKGKSEDILITARGPSIASDIRIGVKGEGATLADLDAALTIDIGATTVGTIPVENLSASVTAKHGAFTLDKLAAHGLGFELGGTGELAADTTVRARFTATGEPDQAVGVLRTAGIAVPPRLPRLPRFDLAVNASGKLDGEIALELEPLHLAIAGGSIDAVGKATLANRQLVEAATTIHLRGLELGAVARLAGRPPPPVTGRLSGTIDIHRTATGQHADYDVALALPQATVRAHGRADPAGATATARFVRGGVDLGSLVATVPLDQGKLVPSRPFHVSLNMPARAVADLLPLVPPELRAKLPPDVAGEVSLRAELDGTPRAPRGTVELAVTGTRHAEVRAVIASGKTGIVVTTTGTGGLDALAGTIRGSVTIPSLFTGQKLVIDKRIAVDETIELAERPLAELPKLPPKIAALGGTVGGQLHAKGLPTALALDGQFAWRGYRTASGAPGATTLAIAGSLAHVTATITHGAATIVAEIDRGTDRFDIRARAHADDTPLLPLLPALFAIPEAARTTAEGGRLRWDMRADLGLAKRATGLALDRATIDGTLAIRGGAFAIPNTTRSWHDIALEIAGDPRGLRLTSLDLRESDRQVKDRRLHASGLLVVENLQPTKASLALETKDWLLIGLTSPVFTDAPTTELDVVTRIEADLTTPIPAIDVTIDSLDYRSPDRKLRAHQPERASVAGDVIFVDAATPAGKLPVIPPVEPLPGGRPLDIRLHLPNPIHINRDPLDVIARGEITVTVRPEVSIPRGEVTLLSGSLNLFAHHHDLVHGRILVSEEHPRGWLELVFERRLPDSYLRDLAHPERGARLTLSGEPSKPQVGISGAVNATLPEVFSMYDAGHSIFTPRPGLPATSTVRAPRGDQINILAFVSLALPHLLFLDRVAAWSDASEPRGAYGRIRNLEADRYTKGDRNRVRAVARPTSPGRSTAELQLDHLLLHDDRKALGIGVRAGDRLGGGVGLVFEWSSSPSR